MDSRVFESMPRWPGAPEMCIKANLPAFVTERALRTFLSANGPSCKVTRIWICASCGRYHAQTIAPDPSGGSSGNGRNAKI